MQDTNDDAVSVLDLPKGLLNLKERNGDSWEAVAHKLYKEAGRNRDKRRELESTIAELEAKVPMADSVVISTEENKLFQQLKQLGNLEEVTTALEAGKAAMQECAALKRRENVRSILPNDYYAEAVLDLLPESASLTEAEDSLVVVDGDKTIPFDDWVDEVRSSKPYISLRRAQNSQANEFKKATPTPKMVRQNPNNSNTTSLLAKYVQEHAKRNYGGKHGRDKI